MGDERRVRLDRDFKYASSANMSTIFSEEESLYPSVHPLKLFDIARAEGRLLYACAPMVRYSKLAFRQTVHHFNTDLTWTPMILAKEFNRSAVARDSDLTFSTSPSRSQPPTIAQFGANDPTELARAASLAAPWISGVDLNCGCPQSWACGSGLGAALMEQRELVRTSLIETRARLIADGWAVGQSQVSLSSPRGRSISVKIRIHKDLRRTVDWIRTVVGTDSQNNSADRLVDWITIHGRTRSTPSTQPVDVESIRFLTETFGREVPIVTSGDVFGLAELPFRTIEPNFRTSVEPRSTRLLSTSSPPPRDSDQSDQDDGSHCQIPIPHLSGLMSARALLANPALFAGHSRCPWAAVDVFLEKVARAPLPLKLAVHHVSEMCGPGYGENKSALMTKGERVTLHSLGNWIEVLDLIEEVKRRSVEEKVE